VQASINDLGGIGSLRPNAIGDGLAITSHGSLVLDMTFDSNSDIHSLSMQLSNIPGVVEHGIFDQLETRVLIGDNGMVREQQTLE